MKTQLLILSAALLFSFTACGQSGKNVPAPVKSAFAQKYATASNVKWGRESKTEWEAEFKMNGKSYSANFDNAGEWMETEYAITITDIPSAVKASLDKESAGSKIESSEVTENSEGKFFEFVIKKGKDETALVIDNEGNIVRKEAEKEENEKEED